MLGETEKAKQELDQAIIIDPELAANDQIRALIYSQLGETEKAQADLKRATELNPERGS